MHGCNKRLVWGANQQTADDRALQHPDCQAQPPHRCAHASDRLKTMYTGKHTQDIASSRIGLLRLHKARAEGAASIDHVCISGITERFAGWKELQRMHSMLTDRDRPQDSLGNASATASSISASMELPRMLKADKPDLGARVACRTLLHLHVGTSHPPAWTLASAAMGHGPLQH